MYYKKRDKLLQLSSSFIFVFIFIYLIILIFCRYTFFNFIEGVDFTVNNPLTHFYFNSTVYLFPISPFGLNTYVLMLSCQVGDTSTKYVEIKDLFSSYLISLVSFKSSRNIADTVQKICNSSRNVMKAKS